jgi:putative FmdB family regulatory protein
MPFYEYQCATCRAHHEALQKITDGPLRKCPSCGKNTLRKLVSAPVFRLKGGGWYETDFKKDKEGQRNIAGDKEPVVEKPKEEKPAAAAADTTVKPAEASKTTQATEKAKPDSTKSAPARKRSTRQRVRK